MPWSRVHDGSDPATESLVREHLEPVLLPLGFAPGQFGFGREEGQVIFCRGETSSPDGGCVDLVLDLATAPGWRITNVRYWGFASDRWHLEFERGAPLAVQLAGLALTLAGQLARG
jgi:hypothetical protein